MEVKDDAGVAHWLSYTAELDADLKRCARRFECRHPPADQRWVRRRPSETDEPQICRQCARCGSASSGPSMSGSEREALPAFDEMRAEAFRTEAGEARRAILLRHLQIQSQTQAEEDHRYRAYLHSPDWTAKRDRVMARAHGVCEGCGGAPATEVRALNQHRRYREFLFDLVAVCDACGLRMQGSRDPSTSRREPTTDTVELLCSDCRWRHHYSSVGWCLKFDVSASEALEPAGACGPAASHREISREATGPTPSIAAE